MVQIIGPGTPRGPSFGQKINVGLGQALSQGQQMMQQHQRREAIKKLGLPENTPSDLAKVYLGEQLRGQSRLNAQNEKSKADRLKGQQHQQQLAESFHNIQQIYSDPNLSEEEKVFGVYQQLNQNPTLAHNLLGSLQKPGKARAEESAAQSFTKGYEALQTGDETTFRDVLSDPETPSGVRNKLVDLQNKFETRKGVKAREIRARQGLVQRSYKGAIENSRKSGELGTLKEREASKKEIKRLEALQRADLKRLSKDPESYSNLAIWNAVDPDFLPEEEGEELVAEEGAPKELEQDAEALLNSLTDEQIEELVRESNGNILVAKKLAMERYGR
jgi:hypothetical protein